MTILSISGSSKEKSKSGGELGGGLDNSGQVCDEEGGVATEIEEEGVSSSATIMTETILVARMWLAERING